MTCTPIAPPASTHAPRTVVAIQIFVERKNIRLIPFAVVVLFFTSRHEKSKKVPLTPASNPAKSRSRHRAALARLSSFSDNPYEKSDLNDFSDRSSLPRSPGAPDATPAPPPRLPKGLPFQHYRAQCMLTHRFSWLFSSFLRLSNDSFSYRKELSQRNAERTAPAAGSGMRCQAQ